ncbi:carbon-nitrogen hydrolase family protein [Leucobacter luti]|uniref:N-carbamoylputrescine amidase n=1 Tax=Leucobacter luti TaxID=340320 RepID=A0A4Q7U0S1_9MICO|nr:carbon-nitrogen hydrolase family protein [Leucobacter luti]MBL3699491.1 carbon-nitrogen hydrolase family protein [Leucobacter luti]RZT67001.1 N-carbamoylputrescine amidase [Leucobacter luti]
MKLAALQLRATGDRDETIRRAAELIDEAAAQGARVVLMPEFFAIPFVQPEPDPGYVKWAEPMDGPSNELCSRKSAEHGITIVSSFFEGTSVPGIYHNTSVTFVRGEARQVYRKSHLPFSNGFPEKFYFRPGQEPPSVVDAGDVKLGTIICYERHFPELSRTVALDGGEVLCVPVASASAPMKEVFQLELRAHAAFNQFFVICSNRVGLEGTKDYFGLSAVYGPDGTVLAQVPDGEEGVAVAEADVEGMRASRMRRPFFRDRRPELYGAIIEERTEGAK